MSKLYIPKKDELEKIASLLAENWGLDLSEKVELHAELRDNPRVRVIRNYISDGPGFFGDIFFICFGGGPEFHLVIGHYKAKDKESWDIYDSEFPRQGGDYGQNNREPRSESCTETQHPKEEEVPS